jgi:pyruvate dehydrogenase (quinone)
MRTAAGARGVEKNVAEWWDTLRDRAMEPADPVNPQRIFHELSPRLPDDVIMTADSGSVANWYARDIRIRRGMMGSLSGGLASLGAATPGALAAPMPYPDRSVIGFIGDGPIQMNGLNVMITASKYWRNWSNPCFILMVLNNEDLNHVTWEERGLQLSPKSQCFAVQPHRACPLAP